MNAPSIHRAAIVETEHVGASTRIDAFACVSAGARIGAHCAIGGASRIEGDVVIEDDVTIGAGVVIQGAVTVGKGAAIGPHSVIAQGEDSGRIVIGTGVSVGPAGTIAGAVTIGENAVIGAGTVVTKNVPPYSIVTGNPALITGYVGAIRTERAGSATPVPDTLDCKVKGASIYRMPLIQDLRGYLSAGENIPFNVKRYFLVFNVPSREARGEHAHREQHQFLVCIRGECKVIVDDGTRREEILLDSPTIGIHVAPMVWAVQYQYSADAILLVLASDKYRPEDYIRDYGEFQKLANGTAVRI